MMWGFFMGAKLSFQISRAVDTTTQQFATATALSPRNDQPTVDPSFDEEFAAWIPP